MTSWCRVLEQMGEISESFEPDPKSVAAIRTGLSIDSNFWNEFLQLCNNPALPDLLGVRREIIARWPAKIRQYLSHVEDIDNQDIANRKSNLITTGY